LQRLSLLRRLPPRSPLFPYTTLFRSVLAAAAAGRPRSFLHYLTRRPRSRRIELRQPACCAPRMEARIRPALEADAAAMLAIYRRSEEHTSELQSRENLVCRLLLEKKN